MSEVHQRVLVSASFTMLVFGYGAEPALAQNAVPGMEQLPAVTVEGLGGSASSSRAELDPNNTANFARVAPSSRPHTETFTRQDIEELQPADIYDLLSHATGVVPTFQGRKLSENLMIRGDSNYGFIIDGAYVPIGTAGRILQTLPMSAIEQVDIVRDSTALMLGPLVDFDSASGALNSGFIVIRTHRPSKAEGELRAAVESYGTVTASGYAGTAYAGGLNVPSAYISGLISEKHTDGPSGYNAWADSQTGLLKGGVSAGALETNWEIFQDHSRYGFERALNGQSTSSLVDQRWSYDPIDTTLITSNSVFSWNAYTSTLLTLSYNAVSAQNVQASYSTAAVSTNEDKTYTFSANLRQNIQFDHTLLQVGGEFVNYNSPTGELFYAGYANAQQTLSGYVHGEQKLLEDRLTLDASVRLDDHEILQGIDLYNQGTGSNTSTTSSSSSSSSAGSGKGASSKTSTTTASTTTYQYFFDRTLPLATSFSGGIAYKVLPQLVATGRYSHTEQGGLTNILSATGQPLDPESQDKWEIGLEAPLMAAFKPGFNFFDTKINNDKIPTSYETINGYQTPLWTESNTERRGFELTSQGTLAVNTWLGQTSYRASWMHLSDVTSSSVAVYSATIAHDVVNGTLTQTWQEYSGTLALNYVAPYYSNFNSADGNYHSVGNFVVVDLHLSRSFNVNIPGLPGSQAKLSVYGRNITDRKYETVYGYPAWGSVWGSELSLTF